MISSGVRSPSGESSDLGRDLDRVEVVLACTDQTPRRDRERSASSDRSSMPNASQAGSQSASHGNAVPAPAVEPRVAVPPLQHESASWDRAATWNTTGGTPTIAAIAGADQAGDHHARVLSAAAISVTGAVAADDRHGQHGDVGDLDPARSGLRLDQERRSRLPARAGWTPGVVAHASRHGSGKDATTRQSTGAPSSSTVGAVGDKAVRQRRTRAAPERPVLVSSAAPRTSVGSPSGDVRRRRRNQK